MKAAIIIPFYNKYELVMKRLQELYMHCPSAEIVLINDASSESDFNGNISWWQKGPLKDRLRYYRNPENLGFGRSMNTGAAIAIKNENDVLLFLSNDVQVQSDIAQEAIEIIQHHKEPVLIGAEMICSKTEWNTLDTCIVPYLNGWLLACHKDVWNMLGGFDPMYGRADFEDVDLSTTAWYMEIKLVLFSRANVRHMGGQTVNSVMPNRIVHTRANKEKWLLKWNSRSADLKEKIYGKG